MPRETITKNRWFVIPLLILAVLFMGCETGDVSPGTAGASSEAPESAPYGPPETIGQLKNPNVTESSGIAASRCFDDVYWTHNDSGDVNLLFAFNSKGDDLGTFIVRDAVNKDWEDIASYRDEEGTCHLFIGDIGNNGLYRSEVTVYRIPEPFIGSAGAKQNVPRSTEAAEAIRFTYPDRRHDAESLMVHPVTGDIYVVTKQMSGAAQVFKVARDDQGRNAVSASKVADAASTSLPAGLFTGGDISPDGRRVVICDYFYGYEFTLPQGEGDFDSVWTQRPVRVDLGNRSQGESVSYSRDGGSIVAGSEKPGSPLNRVTARKP